MENVLGTHLPSRQNTTRRKCRQVAPRPGRPRNSPRRTDVEHKRETMSRGTIGQSALGRASSLSHPGAPARLDPLLRGEGPINRQRTCARALAHVRAGPVVNALGFQGMCYRVIGHLRARQVAGKTPFLDARTAQRVKCKGLAFLGQTRNFRPTIDFDITRFSTTT